VASRASPELQPLPRISQSVRVLAGTGCSLHIETTGRSLDGVGAIYPSCRGIRRLFPAFCHRDTPDTVVSRYPVAFIANRFSRQRFFSRRKAAQQEFEPSCPSWSTDILKAVAQAGLGEST